MNAHWLLRALGVLLLLANTAASQERVTIDYYRKTPAGLVGNGASVVRVHPDGFEFLEGGDATGQFRIVIDGRPYELQGADSHSSFFPGGVSYRLVVHGVEVEVLHGATRDLPYVAALRVRHAKGSVELEFQGRGAPAMAAAGRQPITLRGGEGHVVLSAGGARPRGSWASLGARFEAPYRDGFVLRTPNALVDRAVPFNRFLIDLGFNGGLHVCELFRWRDVWSRDLGSGLAPGAMIGGQFAAARTTIEYDLHRYKVADPRGLKVTEDPSQGGSAEGTAWLTRAVWRYYLLTGDIEFLRKSATTLLPWVNAWIDRDADDRGLLIDVTEWMDHSRFFLFPDGARVLYSNALFVGLLETFAKIETALGNAASASRFDGLRLRFFRGVNSELWNEVSGEYDKLSLWDVRDERSSSDGNVLAILNGVVPAQRVERVLRTIREKNWRSAGSVTITPPMTHVDSHNDHNFKVWPWWNAVEARARFLNGDVAGGIHLLEKFSETLEIDDYPGLVEELTTPEGVTEGGHAFVTAAGAYQDAIFEGLLGIEILGAGRTRIRVSPKVPPEWREWHARVPLPQGQLVLSQTHGRLHITVTDPAVKIIEAPSVATVIGARRATLAENQVRGETDLSSPTPLSVPQPRPRTSATFVEGGIPAPTLAGLPKRQVSAEDLASLDPAQVGALIVPGHALPRRTKSGVDIPTSLSRFLNRGGSIVFYGARMHDRGTMGEHGGVIDCFEYRPRIDYVPIERWKFQASPDDAGVEHAMEYGLQRGRHHADAADAGWIDVNVPQRWEGHPPGRYNGWEWFKARFHLPSNAIGKSVVLTMGRINHRDWTYVNGVLVGSVDGQHAFRSYRIEPTDTAYAALKFGGDNAVTAQVFYEGEAGGLYADATSIGIESTELAWIPLDARMDVPLERPERHGVVSWGRGNFFNSWETSRGAFGFSIEGHGMEFAGPLADIPSLASPTQAAFTDFAVSKPWLFQALTYTTTQRKLLHPDNGERYPGAARIVNTRTGGELILMPLSVALSPTGPEVMKRLRIEFGDER